MKQTYYLLSLTCAVLLPEVAYGAFTFLEIIQNFTHLAELIPPVMASLAVVWFFWGLALFVFKVGGDTKAIKEGRDKMLWGTIALFVIFTVWGLIGFLNSVFGTGGVTECEGPLFDRVSGFKSCIYR